MHTALCAFTDRDRAQAAVAELVRAGFAREDIHVEDRLTSEGREANDAWDGLEREVAVDRRVLDSFGHFFASLLGRDNPSGHVDTYSDHVRRGSYVVVVDAEDEAGAERARGLLQGMRAGDLTVVHRHEQQRLRDIVALSPTAGPDLRDPDLDRAPGLRYADQDKPL
jgi:hypothetical protein